MAEKSFQSVINQVKWEKNQHELATSISFRIEKVLLPGRGDILEIPDPQKRFRSERALRNIREKLEERFQQKVINLEVPD